MKQPADVGFRVHDTELVAALLSRGIQPFRTEWSPDGDRCFFVFPDDAAVSATVADFASGRLVLEASAAFRAFRAARRCLRDAIDRRGARR